MGEKTLWVVCGDFRCVFPVVNKKNYDGNEHCGLCVVILVCSQ